MEMDAMTSLDYSLPQDTHSRPTLAHLHRATYVVWIVLNAVKRGGERPRVYVEY